MNDLNMNSVQTREFYRLAHDLTLENMRQTRQLQTSGHTVERAAWFFLGALCVLGLQWALK